MKSSFALYALAAVGTAFAQSSTASQTSVAGISSTGKPQASASSATKKTGAASAAVPAGVSTACATFLTTLDQDPQFAACTRPLLTATEAFAPTAKNSSQSAQTFTSTLNSLCSNPGCSKTYIRTQLTNFKTACEPELSGAKPNSAIQETYDIMYIVIPLQDALCTKDTDGSYCVTKAPSDSAAAADTTSTGLPNVANNLVTGAGTDQDITKGNIAAFQKNALITHPGGMVRRAAADDQTVIQYAPDTQVFRDTGVAYMFTTPDLSAATLCTHCTQAILTVYAAWESKMPYAMGLSRSPILGSQAQLWKATSQKCGAAFVSQVQGSVGPVVKGLGGALLGGSQATVSAQSGVLTFGLAVLGAFFAL